MAEPKYKSFCGFSLKKSFLTILLLLIQIPDSFGEDCLRCDDFNREKIVECASSFKECGDCKSGFITDVDDDRLCYAIEILDNSVSVPEVKEKGSDVYLPCKFNAVITCVWTKDGMEVNIGANKNYIWSNKGSGKDTDDCSINILALSSDDVGKWQCSNRANSDYDSIKSSEMEVSIIPKVEKHPESIYKVSSGDTVVIACQFDQAVKCSWMRNGRPIKSRDNYRFSEKEKSSDCALTINSFDLSKDQGNWTCLVPGNSESPAVLADNALLIGDPNSAKNPLKTVLPSVKNLQPVISYKGQSVNRKVLELSSAGFESFLNDLKCSAGSEDVASLSWLVHDDVEYLGLRIGNSIFVDQTLTNNIIGRLSSNQNVELFCLVKFSNKHTELATVTIAKTAEFNETGQLDTANINTLLIILIVVIVILMGGILGAVTCLVCYCMRKNQKGLFKRTDSNRASINSQTELLSDPA